MNVVEFLYGIVNKKKGAEERTSVNEPVSESVNDCQIVLNKSFSNLDLDLYNLQLLKQTLSLELVHQLLEY